MKNNLWGTESFSEKPVHVVLFCSRNKDNQSIEGFKERRESFITNKEIDSEYLQTRFKEFAGRGLPLEQSRMYYSVNARDPQKIWTGLMHFMFDNPDFNLCSIQPKIAGIAAQKECALEKKWMFDFDINDKEKVNEFVKDIINLSNPIQERIITHKTPHGYAVIVDHGFDCRELLEKWGEDVTLKRDDLLCVKWLDKEDSYA